MRRFIALLLMLVISSGLCAATEKEWTILVYAVTDSFLADTVMNDIDEMEMLGSSDQVEILVQLDKNDYNPVRYRVKHDERPGFIASSIVGSPQNTDCGSWETLYEFACWGIERAPAKRYMLVLHGCLGSLGYGAPVKDILVDGEFVANNNDLKFKLDKNKIVHELEKENGARYMGIRQMGFALAAISKKLGKKIDLVCVDDSCDCSIEKMFEYKNFVNFWVASAGFLPSDNWPYELFLAPLKNNPQASPEHMAKHAVQAFKHHYTPYCSLPYGFGATLTAFRLEEGTSIMENLKELSAPLYKLAKRRENRIKILELQDKVLSYLSADETDLLQVASGLSRLELGGDAEFVSLCKTIAGQVEKIRLAHWADGRHYGDSSGVSLRLSRYLFGYDLQKYKLLEWDKFSRWSKFLVRLSKN